jgi:hypothetical protein
VSLFLFADGGGKKNYVLRKLALISDATILSLGRFLKIFENESRKHTSCKVWVTGFLSEAVMLLS